MAFFLFLACSIFAEVLVSTLTTLALYDLVSYDTIINIDKKMNLFALPQKIEFGLCKKLENFVINKT